MKIFVTGTRGIPDIPGGVEKHCEELFPRIAARGHEVIVAIRSAYVTQHLGQWGGVRLVDVYAPRTKNLEAIVHTALALISARLNSPDIVHINAIGPSILAPIARMMGLKVVVTNHGPDYDREKWGRFAKHMLRLGELLGSLFANEVIVISEVIGSIIRNRCKRESNLIYNGVTLPLPSVETDYLKGIGVRAGNYILSVARMVPEKGIHNLIEAFLQTDGDYQLVIAGDADHETDYSRGLKKQAAESSRIILTGYITGEPLNQVYSHARLFVLPSSHEGLPISLLEALSYGLPVLVSDIPANLEVGLASDRYFRCANIKDLKDKLEWHLRKDLSSTERDAIRLHVAQKYDWDRIADQTLAVYEKVLAQK
jgi:glycosyltransferase involved in cell wall biosynthesis